MCGDFLVGPKKATSTIDRSTCHVHVVRVELILGIASDCHRGDVVGQGVEGAHCRIEGWEVVLAGGEAGLVAPIVCKLVDGPPLVPGHDD